MQLQHLLCALNMTACLFLLTHAFQYGVTSRILSSTYRNIDSLITYSLTSRPHSLLKDLNSIELQEYFHENQSSHFHLSVFQLCF